MRKMLVLHQFHFTSAKIPAPQQQACTLSSDLMLLEHQQKTSTMKNQHKAGTSCQ